MRNIYFVDLENVGKTFLEGAENLKMEDEVILFHNKAHAGEHVSSHIDFAVKMCRCKVTQIVMNTRTKNAMDMEICTCLGMRVSEYKGSAQYFIVSRDNDYWPSIDYIRDYSGCRAFVRTIKTIGDIKVFDEHKDVVKELIDGVTLSKKQLRILVAGIMKCTDLSSFHNVLQTGMPERATEVYHRTKEYFMRQHGLMNDAVFAS